MLARTPDDFGLTLAGNPVSKPIIDKVHRTVIALHKKRCQEARAAQEGASVLGLEDIGQRRCAY